ncbi:MAG TPA: DUF2330 domain-containing protein [Myxococcota bacterium]|nr:DUF2330 domain-containing protein [Myxococcota bacterium]
MLVSLLPQALACGGLFCSAPTLPVDQTGERIVFAFDEASSTVEMHTQIAYEGPAETFAWLVPLPERPELFVSTDELFQLLDRRTAPVFQLQSVCECCDAAPQADSDNAVSDSGGAGGSGGVTVAELGLVGPYETATLQATSVEAMTGWLTANGYYLPDGVAPFLAPYVADGAFVVALRLQKDRTTGDLVPLGARYHADAPMIPLTMTAVAATPDMALLPWVLSSGRAVPENYLHVVVNELAIDWWRSGANYSEVVGRAADLAGGQAFATDYAGPTEPFVDALVWPGRFDVPALRDAPSQRELWGTILSQGFIVDSRLVALMTRFFPDAADVLASLGGGDTGAFGPRDPTCDLPDVPGCAPVDVGPAVDALVAEVVEPLERANGLFAAHRYVTRLTSSASPDEMTVDPRFVINPDMPDVAQTRAATIQSGDCDGDGLERLTLPGGDVVHIPVDVLSRGEAMSYLSAFADLPALRIESTGRSGDPVVVSDASADIQAAIGQLDPPAAIIDDPKVACSCDAGHASGAPLGLLLALGLRRRR